MKIALLAIVLIASDAHSDELRLGFYPAFAEDGRPGAGLIFEISEKADRVISYDKENNFDLGLGKIIDGARFPIGLKFDEIRNFLEDEKHKGCIVIYFEKSVMWNDKSFIADRANEVTKQMQEVGFKRVVILGAHSSGIHYVADTTLKADQGGAANPVKSAD